MPDGSAAPLRLAVAVALLGAIVHLLTAAGRGPLAAPPVSSWDAVDAWYASSGTVVAAVTALRLVALALAIALLAVLVLELAGTVPALHPLRRAAEVLAPRYVRQLVGTLAGISLSAGVVVSASSTPPAPHTPPTTVADHEPSGTATIREITPGPGVETPAPPPPTAPPAAEGAEVGSTVVVAPGDSFWSIAEAAVHAETGRPVAGREVVRYWRALIEVNRERLVDPRNPDLIYAGQRFVLPG